MEVRVRHLSDKNQSIIRRTDTINQAISQKHSSLEKEGMVIPQQAISQVKTREVLFQIILNSVTVTIKDVSRYLNRNQNNFVNQPFLGQVWRHD